MRTPKIKKLRRLSQILFLVILIFSYVNFGLSWTLNFVFYLILSAILSSLLFGRAYCSWVCPLGTIYEFYGIIMKKEKARYHCRVGCPVSLVLGVMNRFSLFQICKDENLCLNCNSCKRACPVGVFEIAEEKAKKMGKDLTPQKLYACIRCLNCVDACPVNALKLQVKKQNR